MMSANLFTKVYAVLLAFAFLHVNVAGANGGMTDPQSEIRNLKSHLLASFANPQSANRNQKPLPELLTLEGDISPIHDPAIIREGATFYVFASNRFQGKHVPIFCSQDLRQWRFCGNVFDKVPDWALEEVPGARGIWAPDIAFVDGRFLLYYSVSTFATMIWKNGWPRAASLPEASLTRSPR